jgi:hypothetical protein
MSYLAVGVDVSPVFQKRGWFANHPELHDWHLIYTGRSLAPLSPALFGVWKRAQRGLVSYNDLLASLADGHTDPAGADAVAKEVLSEFPFADWPWYDGGTHSALLYSELLVVGAPNMLNPAPQHIPDALWSARPPISALEAAIERSPGMDPGSARRALITALPIWLATVPSLRLELYAPPAETTGAESAEL